MRPSFLRRAALPALALAACALAVAGRAGSSSKGIDPANIDPNTSACTDFFQYANGGWLARNEIPPAFSVWGSASGVREKNIAVLKQVLEEAAADKTAKPGSNQQKVGDFYAACMDEARAEAEGAKPLAPGLEQIAKLRDAKGLPALVGYLHGQGISTLFGFGSSPDLKESRQTIASIGQGGLGMPDRDYYLKDDEKSKQLREAYARMVTNMFKLLGDTPEQAQAGAQTVMRLETELARNSLDRVARRDPNRQYNKMTVAELQKLAPSFDFAAYFKGLGAPAFADLNVGQPDFFRGLDKVIAGASPEDLRTYLRWHLVRGAANALSTPFFNESFEFYGKALTGAKQPQERWRRCVSAADSTLGEALGEAYVKRAFPPESKARMQQLVNNLVAALRDDIPTLQWMSEATRKSALDKLAAFKQKIGYPDRWRDYSALKVERASHVENLRRAAAFERRRDLAKIGRPVDKTEWFMTPPTVNAYHYPLFSEIVFPAGILQPPLFNPEADDAVNYGGIGSVIGHEITHGFDDQGRKYDLHGNLRDWWTEADAKAYDERARCVEEQFSGFEVEPGLRLTGKLVLGESIADLGGLKLAWLAFQKSLEGKPRPEKIDGFTAEQRFFLGYAQAWARKYRAEELRRLAAVDPHPPGMYRVNGPVSNMPQFAEAFQCKAGDPMVRPADKRCQVW
ncbi:MAG TPA: M13 family metallopeptidase [Pyrinomonadaceae bacterium]|nr:M13 family metallopeptidase [Pyrinomonadaceae bacterium]